MIYISKCRICGMSSLAPDCLKDMQVCGDCFVAPATGLNLDYIGQQV